MGKNTPTRQLFIIDNLKVEKDVDDPQAVKTAMAEEELVAG
jgi:hypothetical protein